jgi:hypothetical protein
VLTVPAVSFGLGFAGCAPGRGANPRGFGTPLVRGAGFDVGINPFVDSDGKTERTQ